MRLITLLTLLFPKSSSSLHRLLYTEDKHLHPDEFLLEVLRRIPDEMHVRVVGLSMIAVFEFAHNGVVYSTVYVTFWEFTRKVNVFYAYEKSEVKSSRRHVRRSGFKSLRGIVVGTRL